MESMMEFVNGLNTFIVGAAEQPWVCVLVFACCTFDGFFPPVPSESVVVGLASVVASAGSPNVWLLILAAGLGAFAGDNVAYVIGRGIGTTRFAWMRRPRMQRGFVWAGRELDKRAASLIMIARFIPIGRVAVNLTAGATKYSRRRFVFLTTISAIAWSSYSVGIGLFFGQWFAHNHLLGACLAIACAVVIGLTVDRVIAAVRGEPNGGDEVPARADSEMDDPVDGARVQ